MTTITTGDVAGKVGLTLKSVRMAIKRGDLRATRQRRGREQTTFLITRADADDWIRRRKAGTLRTEPPPEVEHPRRALHHAYFPDSDEDDYKERMDKMLVAALSGREEAKQYLREMPQPLIRWFRAGVGEVI